VRPVGRTTRSQMVALAPRQSKSWPEVYPVAMHGGNEARETIGDLPHRQKDYSIQAGLLVVWCRACVNDRARGQRKLRGRGGFSTIGMSQIHQRRLREILVGRPIHHLATGSTVAARLLMVHRGQRTNRRWAKGAEFFEGLPLSCWVRSMWPSRWMLSAYALPVG